MQIGRDALPPPLMTSTPGSFARKTIVERKPQILREVSQAHPYPSDIQAELKAFAAEIASRPIQPLREEIPDRTLWNREWQKHEGQTWLNVPWYFAETFFYRRLMEVVRFYQPGPWYDVDPFAPQKAAELERALLGFLAILDQPCPNNRASFTWMLYDALWGNRADLSNRTISATADEGLRDRQAHRLLIDHTPQIWHHLQKVSVARVDIVTDNSGLELLLDLRLVALLLQTRLAAEVRIHLKHMPFFVSDAMIRDLEHTLERLERYPSGSALAVQLRRAIADGRLTLQDDPFWSTCLTYHQLPAGIAHELAGSDLVLFKGDVNYRRLLDDRQWPYTTCMADIIGPESALVPFPAPFATLRTLKGELIVDLEPGQAESLAAEDPAWLINGQRGLIRFVDRDRCDG
jgi:uncharacterized protein with ATP-grasp and redox domains